MLGPHDDALRVAPIVSFTLPGVHAHDVAQILGSHGVCVRAGHHCCQPLMDHLGIPGTIRASAYVYNSEGEIDALVAGLNKVVSRLRSASPGAAKADR